MSYEYSDKSRESDAHALPDVEVFRAYSHQCEDCSEEPIPLSPDYYGLIYVKGACPTCGGTVRCTDTKVHYWYAFGFPGCLWDSDPAGPFDTYEQALTEAREQAGYCPHGIADDGDDVCKECPAPELWVLEFDPLWFASCGGSGRTPDSSKAQAWSTKEAAETARDRMAFCDGSQAVRLPDAEARSWGR